MKPRVAVVGSGPSGLAAAEALLDRGIEVSLFDGGRLPGGRPLYVADLSAFPAMPAQNPTMTAAANAMRVADALADRLAAGAVPGAA